MNDDVTHDVYIIEQIREQQKENDRRIQLEVPDYYDYNHVEDQKKDVQEPKRVIIIEL